MGIFNADMLKAFSFYLKFNKYTFFFFFEAQAIIPETIKQLFQCVSHSTVNSVSTVK